MKVKSLCCAHHPLNNSENNGSSIDDFKQQRETGRVITKSSDLISLQRIRQPASLYFFRVYFGQINAHNSGHLHKGVR